MRAKKPTPADESRLARGRVRDEARFTAAPPVAELPASYPATLAEIKRRVQQSRLRTVLAANATMVMAYWEIGQVIRARQQSEGWGAKVIDRLSADLRETFPDMQGLSPRNLKYMRSFATAWPDVAIVQEALAQIGWYQNITLLDKLSDATTRLWYAQQAAHHGWSQSILCIQIETRLHQRQGKAPNNFPQTLPPADSDLAAQIFKDPYLFDFLGTADPRREREVEQALVDHMQRFLLELGAGFAFVGRQVHLEVGDQDFYLDLLFYHLKLRRYVVSNSKPAPSPPAMSASSISTFLPWMTSCATPTTKPPSACCCAGRKTNSSRNTPCAAWINPSPSPNGRPNSQKPCLRNSKAVCRPWQRSKRNWPGK